MADIYLRSLYHFTSLVIQDRQPGEWDSEELRSCHFLLTPSTYCPHFEDNTFVCIFMKENEYNVIKISLEFICLGPAHNRWDKIPEMGLHQTDIMALPEPMLTKLTDVYTCHQAIRLAYLPLDKMATISQIIFSNVFLSMKIFEFRLKFHWNLGRLTIFQHWFR